MKVLGLLMAISGGHACDLTTAMNSMPNLSFRSTYAHFIITGHTRGTIMQQDGRTGDNYHLGNFQGLSGSASNYVGGTFCEKINGKRSARMNWRCGATFQVTSSSEPSVCNYHFQATMPCCDVTNPQAWDASKPAIKWTAWSSYSSCSTTCGGGMETRTRTCQGGSTCPGAASEQKSCNPEECPEWGTWGSYSSCSTTCGDGVEIRTRTCDGGSTCPGAATEQEPCNLEECEFLCPSTACWTYVEATKTCSMKPECATLQCGATSFDVTFKSALFNFDDNQSPVTFAGMAVAPAWDGAKWTKNVLIGSNGMTYEIDTVANEITFSVLFAVVGNDMKTRQDDIQDYLINLGSKSVVTTPFGAGIVFQCTYPLSVDISSENYAVVGASVVDTYSATGSLAAGFDMILNNGEDPSFLLGSIVQLGITWTVSSLPLLTYYLDHCSVTHGATEIDIVKGGCYASGLKVEPETSMQEFSYKVFKAVGETSDEQMIKCTVIICEKTQCQFPTLAQCPASGDDIFYGYTV